MGIGVFKLRTAGKKTEKQRKRCELEPLPTGSFAIVELTQEREPRREKDNCRGARPCTLAGVL